MLESVREACKVRKQNKVPAAYDQYKQNCCMVNSTINACYQLHQPVKIAYLTWSCNTCTQQSQDMKRIRRDAFNENDCGIPGSPAFSKLQDEISKLQTATRSKNTNCTVPHASHLSVKIPVCSSHTILTICWPCFRLHFSRTDFVDEVFQTKRTYIPHLTAGPKAKETIALGYVQDAGSVMKQLNENHTGKKWVCNINWIVVLYHEDATTDPRIFFGIILLEVWLEYLRTRAQFGFFPSLAAELLLGTSFVDRFCDEIIPTEHKRVTSHSQHDSAGVIMRQSTYKNVSSALLHMIANFDTSKTENSTASSHPKLVGRQFFLSRRMAHTY